MSAVRPPRAPARCAWLLAAGLVAGCATGPGARLDPLEPYNRSMYAFNSKLDAAVLRPAARAYEALAPLPVRSGVGNFFANLGDLWTAVNDALQGKGGDAASDLGRFLVNSTLGILGVFDIASELGLERHDEDFGQTLGVWGVGRGAFVVLPVLGPRTVRDSLGLGVDWASLGAWTRVEGDKRLAASALWLVDRRAALLPVDAVIARAAIDEYAYVRDAYLQKRRFDVYDGRVPAEAEGE